MNNNIIIVIIMIIIIIYALQGANVRTSCISYSLSQNSLSDKQIQSEKPVPAIRDAQKRARNVFPP